ncbi:hypothetical protein RO575_02680 [Methylomonas sp. MO1]|uniref:hypothetical protein n=1 Tax=Methylomonas sp. MO1 TaxID=3073619 RepID=UPI0028A35C3D|nr:hypothetical protein [Methylomonas sp. MO1]MDT4288455.1 hypothetical protein [Methylomonas sp. MO1]
MTTQANTPCKQNRRLDIEIGRKLFRRLLQEIRPYGDTHPGAALVEWLDDVLDKSPF